MTITNPFSRFHPMCWCTSRMVLLVNTNRVEAEHQWCLVLNTLQYVVGREETCCKKRVVLLKENKSYLVRRLVFLKTSGNKKQAERMKISLK